MIFGSTTNLIFSIAALIGQIAILVVVASFFVGDRRLVQFFGRHAILFAFIIALTATLGSLFYSEVVGYEPCKLCWFQRIFMYPQAIILGLALWKKDQGIGDYSIMLSLIGAAIAGYHYLLQMGVASELSCSAVGLSPSCSQFFATGFGYITIPLMTFTAFVLMIVLFLAHKRVTSGFR